jgi:hypothetical protein
MSAKLRVKEVRVSNVLGIREAAMEPGNVTVISGDNAEGKTSFMRAMQATLGRGNLASIKNIDEEDDPKVVIVLDGEQGHYRVTGTDKQTKIVKRVGDTQGFEDVQKPSTWLGDLYDGLMSNPIEFMKATDKKRIKMLLDALPIELDREKLLSLVCIDENELPDHPAGLHPLQYISMVHDHIFNERKGINRDRRNKIGSGEELRRTIPAVIPADLDSKVRALELELTDESVVVEREKNERQAELDAFISKEKFELEKYKQSERDALKVEIAELKTKLEERINYYSRESVNRIEDEKKKFDAETDTSVEQAIQEKRLELERLKVEAKEAVKNRTLQRQAERFENDADTLREYSEELTTSLKNIEQYRRSLADNLPIEGLEVDEKTIKFEGVPWDQVNTAKQISVAVQLACLRAQEKPLPLVWIDGGEALGRKNFEILVNELNKYEVQAVIGVVKSDEPLTFEKK